jgi:hypothetical protein
MKYLFGLRILFIFFWSYLFFFGSSYLSFYDLFSIFDILKSFDIIDSDEICFLEDIIESTESNYKYNVYSDIYLLIGIFILLVVFSFVLLPLVSSITIFEFYALSCIICMSLIIIFFGLIVFIVVDFFYFINVFEFLESYYLDSSSLFERINDLFYIRYIFSLFLFISLIGFFCFFFYFVLLSDNFFKVVGFFYFYSSWWLFTLIYFFSPFGGDFLDIFDYVTFIFLCYLLKFVFSSSLIFFLRLNTYLKL